MVRVKHRYLVINFLYPLPPTTSKSSDPAPELLQFHAPTPDAFHVGLLLRVIRDGVTELFGEYGMGIVGRGLKINYWSPSTSTAIVRCPRDHYEMVWAALTFTTRLPRPADAPVVVKVVRVSGTIRKAEEEVIRGAKMIIRRAKAMEEGNKDEMIESVTRAVEKRNVSEKTSGVQVDEVGEDNATGTESE